MCNLPRNLLIQATLTMVVMQTWCGTTLIHIIRFRTYIYSVLVNGAFVQIMLNDSGGVQYYSSIPHFYKGRVKIEGRATLVIKNVNPKDNTKFRCELETLELFSSTVELIVTGM